MGKNFKEALKSRNQEEKKAAKKLKGNRRQWTNEKLKQRVKITTKNRAYLFVTTIGAFIERRFKQTQGTILITYTIFNFHDIRITMTEPSRDPTLPEKHETETL